MVEDSTFQKTAEVTIFFTATLISYHTFVAFANKFL